MHAQNIGVGTTDPTKTLSVRGTVLIDQANENHGTPDSAALLFGTQTKVGIFSNRMNGAPNYNGLDFWTNNTRRLQISSGGYVGINLGSNDLPAYTLDVNGSIRSKFNVYVNNSLTSDWQYVNYNSYVYGSSYVADYMGIATSPTSSYRLKVNGNALIQTNLGVDGTARVDGKITNEGKAIMLSNNATTLRSGFNSGTFTYNNLAPGAYIDINFIVTPFTGSNSNIRVMVAQFQPGNGASNWGSVVMTPHATKDSDPQYNNQSTCTVRFTNTGSTAAALGTNAVLYLYSVVTN